MRCLSSAVSSPARLSLLALALMLCLGWSTASAETPPLEISLDAPSTCYAEAAQDFDTETVSVAWQVRGGEAPYDIFINGELRQGASGALDVRCGRWRWSSMTAGPILIQATVTDAAGRKASTIADMYAIHMVTKQPRTRYGEYSLIAGETYLIRGVPITMPLSTGASLGPYVTDECPTWGPECDDRFSLRLGSSTPYGPTALWIRRWSATEYSRVLDGIEVLAGQEPQHRLRYDAHWGDERADEILDLIDTPPRRYPYTQPISTEDPNMSMKMYAPTYCKADDSSRYNIDVQWEVSGGHEPIEITINGERYLGREGRVQVMCGIHVSTSYSPYGGHMRIQGTAVDKRGHTASARVDTYALSFSYAQDMQFEDARPYQFQDQTFMMPLEMLRLFFTSEEHRPQYFDYCRSTVDEERDCEQSVRYTYTKDGHTISFVLGGYSGTVSERTPRSQTSQELNQLIDALIDSIGKPPPLPDGFVESNAPLQISAFADPVVCEYDGRIGSARVYATATGGRWWPLRFEAKGERYMRFQDDVRVPCDQLVKTGRIDVRVSEQGIDPPTESIHVQIPTRRIESYNREHQRLGLSSQTFLDSEDYCSTGEQLDLSSSFQQEGQPLTLWHATDGRERWTGRTTITCPSLPGTMQLRARLPKRFSGDRIVEYSYVFPVRQAQPERTAR